MKSNSLSISSKIRVNTAVSNCVNNDNTVTTQRMGINYAVN